MCYRTGAITTMISALLLTSRNLFLHFLKLFMGKRSMLYTNFYSEVYSDLGFIQTSLCSGLHYAITILFMKYLFPYLQRSGYPQNMLIRWSGLVTLSPTARSGLSFLSDISGLR